MSKRVDFKKETKDLVRFNAGWICNNPSCRKIIIDHSAGVVGHIIGASPNGPRGSSDDKEVISSESNAIYLCKPCEVVVDKNPDEYPVDMLYRWKEMATDFFTKFCKTIHFGADRCILPICINPACQKILIDYRWDDKSKGRNHTIHAVGNVYANLKGYICPSCYAYIKNSKIPKTILKEWYIYSEKNWDFIINSRVKVLADLKKELQEKKEKIIILNKKSEKGIILNSKSEKRIMELEKELQEKKEKIIILNSKSEKRIMELEKEIHHVKKENDELIEANKELENLNYEFVHQNKEMKENMIKAESEKGYLFGLFDKS